VPSSSIQEPRRSGLLHSYISADRQITFAVYDAPSPEAIRRTASSNKLPVDSSTEVPVLDPYFFRQRQRPGIALERVGRDTPRTPTASTDRVGSGVMRSAEATKRGGDTRTAGGGGCASRSSRITDMHFL
jgi:uncharacterized protein DUF4242